MRILITNDDGIEAEGIRRVAEMAVRLGEVWVVAPAGQCSAMSQRITLREKLIVAEQPFSVPVHKAYSVTGTPADCVKVALYHLMEEEPDFVFSGMNDGFNAGFDIAYSGTVGAAMEGIMNGIPSIAFSNERGSQYEAADQYMEQITREILEKPVLPDGIWNINFPGCPVSECKGILWDRQVAKMQYYRDHFDVKDHARGSELSVNGIPSDGTDLPDQSDYEALNNRYVSVGIVKCSVLL